MINCVTAFNIADTATPASSRRLEVDLPFAIEIPYTRKSESNAPRKAAPETPSRVRKDEPPNMSTKTAIAEAPEDTPRI